MLGAFRNRPHLGRRLEVPLRLREAGDRIQEQLARGVQFAHAAFAFLFGESLG